jgi:hypothetical protein
MATASAKFMRRPRVPAVEPLIVRSDEPADALIATPSAVTPAEAETGREPGLDLSMDTDAGECPHLSIRMEAAWSYRVGLRRAKKKKTACCAQTKKSGILNLCSVSRVLLVVKFPFSGRTLRYVVAAASPFPRPTVDLYVIKRYLAVEKDDEVCACLLSHAV